LLHRKGETEAKNKQLGDEQQPLGNSERQMKAESASVKQMQKGNTKAKDRGQEPKEDEKSFFIAAGSFFFIFRYFPLFCCCNLRT